MTKAKIIFLVAVVAAVAISQCSGARMLRESFQQGEEEFLEMTHTSIRQLQQEALPDVITAPVNFVSGALCGMVPRSIFEENFGLAWWMPMGVAQGACAGQVSGSVLGLSY
jgi:uncharacterized membrane protein